MVPKLQPTTTNLSCTIINLTRAPVTNWVSLVEIKSHTAQKVIAIFTPSSQIMN